MRDERVWRGLIEIEYSLFQRTKSIVRVGKYVIGIRWVDCRQLVQEKLSTLNWLTLFIQRNGVHSMQYPES